MPNLKNPAFLIKAGIKIITQIIKGGKTLNAIKYISCGLIAGAAIGSIYAFMKGSTPSSRRRMKRNYNTAKHAVAEMISGVKSSVK